MFVFGGMQLQIEEGQVETKFAPNVFDTDNRRKQAVKSFKARPRFDF
jgi:hypothetical protein